MLDIATALGHAIVENGLDEEIVIEALLVLHGVN